MSLSRQRITLVTLGVADMDRARAFYEAWGWSPHTGSQPGVTFYQMNGAVLALFGLADLAADQGRPGAGLGTGAVTLAQNCPDDRETDTVFQAAIDAGLPMVMTGHIAVPALEPDIPASLSVKSTLQKVNLPLPGSVPSAGPCRVARSAGRGRRRGTSG